jgi:beta-glucosidase
MELRGFERIPPIAPGESTHVVFELDVLRDLWLVNLKLDKVVEPGSFTLMIGGASDAIQLNAELTVQ